MKAGQLKEKIAVLFPSINTSEFGENKTEYIAKYITRAAVKITSQNRENTNNEIFYSTTVEFTVRSYNKIDDFDRIEWKGKQYRILSIIPNDLYQEIQVITEVVNE